MLKNAFFSKIRLSAPTIPRLPQTPRVVIFAYYYSIVEMRFITFKKEQNNYSKCSVFASSALFHLVFISNSILFVDRGLKNISCPRAQGTLATPLFVTLL